MTQQSKTLSLHFSNAKYLELMEIHLSYPQGNGQSARLVRGKTPEIVDDKPSEHLRIGSFQWTTGVKALCVLLLRAKAGIAPYHLEGKRGSLASSLDFAIAKPPLWLTELFGWDSRGEALVRRFFKRSNPELKKPGPAQIALNFNTLPAEAIEITVNGEALNSSVSILALAETIEQAVAHSPQVLEEDRSSATSTELFCDSSSAEHYGPFANSEFRRFWQDAYQQEIAEMFSTSDVFTANGLRQVLTKAREHPLLNSIAGENVSALDGIDSDLPTSVRLGLLDEDSTRRALCQDEPLRISFSWVYPPLTAICYYLRYIKGYHLEWNYQYPYAVEIAKRMLSDAFDSPPDLCALGIGPTGTYLGEAKNRCYNPCMMLPNLSHRVVAPSSDTPAGLNDAEYYFANDDPTTACFYFDYLEKAGLISRNKIGIHHGEPDELYQQLSEKDTDKRAVLWFPHYSINRLYNDCQLVEDAGNEGNTREVFLFAHDRLTRDSNRLSHIESAVRDAWLTLNSNPETLQQVCKLMMDDPVHQKTFVRFSGLDRDWPMATKDVHEVAAQPVTH